MVVADRDFRTGVGVAAAGLGNWQPGVTNYVSSRGLRNNNQACDVNGDPWGMFSARRGFSLSDILDGASNGAARNVSGVFSPRRPNFEGALGIDSRLARRNDGFVTDSF